MEDDRRHRLAVVDCGTNTFTLHIARFDAGGWKSVFRQRRFVRLGHDSFRTGRLSPLRMRRGLDVLSSFRETALNFGVTHVRAIGVQSRDARQFLPARGHQGTAPGAQRAVGQPVGHLVRAPIGRSRLHGGQRIECTTGADEQPGWLG